MVYSIISVLLNVPLTKHIPFDCGQMERTQKQMLAAMADSDIHRTGLEQKLDSVITTLGKLDRKLSSL